MRVLSVLLLVVSAVAASRFDDAKITYLDLQPKSNHKLKDNFHTNTDGNNLSALKAGEQKLGDVKFKIGDGLIQLGSKMVTDKPDKVDGIKVEKAFNKLHILHATGYTADEEALLGEYTINWDDGTSVTIPIVYGKDVRDWWYTDESQDVSRGKIVWRGDNEYAKSLNSRLRLFMTTWDNPKPDLKVTSIDYSTNKETNAAPFCVAMTIEGK